MNKQQYPTDVTDSQGDIIQQLIPPAKSGGRPRTLDMRQVINAILYIVVGGIQWRMLPKDYPKWQSVYYYFRRWWDDGRWQRIHDTLRAEVRRQAGRHEHPTAGCLDSQSVKTGHTPQGIRGFDGGKLITGRKRHILVDTCGLLLAVVVTSAAVQDRDGARLLVHKLAGFCKKLRLIDWVAQKFSFRLKLVQRPIGQKGFVLLARRWLVERTFSWFGLHRRLSKDYERLPQSSEAFIYIAMTRLMLRRLAPK